MYIQLANVDSKDKDRHIEIIRDITEEEVSELKSYFLPATQYKYIKEIYSMGVSNGKELLDFLNSVYINDKFILDLTGSEIYLKGNRLLANYCLFIGMFIDYVEKALSKYGKEKVNHFQEYCSYLYDSEFEYRFIARLRNFIAHYSFPLSVYTNNYYGKKLEMSRKQLLGFKKWNTVKRDIEELSETIDFRAYITPMNVNLTALLLYIQHLLAPEVVKSLNKFTEFQQKNKVVSPAIIKFIDLEAFKRGDIKMEPIVLNPVFDFLKEIENNPKVNIKINYL
ncbi:hypothetical protein [Sporosarcina sp. FSL K6-3457]|uniref:hypothetical protein n=1 Tax=Sporosarcina sp. FSL K6-3457 TaxID=2978204 RepID=UPI0030FA81FF